MNGLERKHIERFSSNGFIPNKAIPVIKKNHYIGVYNVTLTGDAPKEFVRIYHYDHLHRWTKSNPKNWPAYIAKTGHKWYPNESITEFLLNQLGEEFGLNMAKSKLAIINGQIRFLSQYFLRHGKDQLIHGAEIFAGYLEDEQLVTDIEEQGDARELFTLQFVEKAISALFPNEKNAIMHELIRLVLFDALVGNNDRHYFNWGVIKNMREPKHQVKFAPIYDTARGLFWNDDDNKIIRRLYSSGNSGAHQYIAKYCKNSKPKLGWDGIKDINHFKMVEQISSNEFYISKRELQKLFSNELLNKMYTIIDHYSGKLYISERTTLIKECLTYRFNEIQKLI